MKSFLYGSWTFKILQVDYSGFMTINPQRFGQKYVGKVVLFTGILDQEIVFILQYCAEQFDVFISR